MDVDAVLLIGFGGPEGPDDVLPFLRRVTAGKGIPDSRLIEVGRHYEAFGGVSPINAYHRDLLRKWHPTLQRRWPGMPLYWGNRNSEPFIADALRQMRADGVASAIAVATSAFSSYPGCRQYRQDIAAARAGVSRSPEVSKAHPFFDHPALVSIWADRLREGLAAIAGAGPALVLFCTHSLPVAAARASGPGGTGAYVAQHLELARAIMAQVAAGDDWDLCYQSRSGPPHQPWLEPDVGDRLATAADQGYRAVALAPLGFMSDHIEVLWDLDTVALAAARRLGLRAVRVATPGTDDRFPLILTDLVAEYLGEGGFPSFRPDGPLPACPADCCLPGMGRPARAT